MAGHTLVNPSTYPFQKYDANDWRRLPGRLFENILTGDVTTRRQFDQHYGSVKFFGTNEKKARSNKRANEAKQMLSPARGRKSALRQSPAQREVELGKRRVIQKEKAQQKLIEKLHVKKNRTPKKINLKNFRKGTQIRRFRTGVDQAEIEQLRDEAMRSGIVFGYWVGLEMVSDRDGKLKTPSLFSQRDINTPFTDEDLEKAMHMAQIKNYAELTGMFIAFHLKFEQAKKNGVKFHN